jgi:hypothetical protein
MAERALHISVGLQTLKLDMSHSLISEKYNVHADKKRCTKIIC